jgi:hypothetical protein
LTPAKHRQAMNPPRFSAKLRDALDNLVYRGQKPADACASAGIHCDSLRKALKRPDVLAYLNQQYEVVRTQARARTIHRAEELADNAQSEHVRFQANEWLAAIDGIAPVARGEIQHKHSGSVVAGLVVVRAASPSAGQIELASGHKASLRPRIRRLGDPVPHPTLVKGEAGEE